MAHTIARATLGLTQPAKRRLLKMAQPSNEDRERSNLLLLAWKYNEIEIERMYIKLRDKVHARLYRAKLESNRLKAEGKWLISIIEEKRRLKAESKRLMAESKWPKSIDGEKRRKAESKHLKAECKSLKSIIEEKRRKEAYKRLHAEYERLKQEYNRLTLIIEEFESLYEPWREQAVLLLKRREWIDEFEGCIDEPEDLSMEKKQLASKLEQLAKKANKKLKELAKNIDSRAALPNNLEQKPGGTEKMKM